MANMLKVNRMWNKPVIKNEDMKAWEKVMQKGNKEKQKKETKEGK